MSEYIDDDNLWKENLYDTLGLEYGNASDGEIKKAYLKLAKKFHPDKFVNNDDERLEAQRIFSKITVAYDVLSDPGKRNHYLDLRRLLASHLPENQTVIVQKSEEKTKPEKSSAQNVSPTPPPQNPPPHSSHKVDETPVAEKLKEEQARALFNAGMEYMKKKKNDQAIDSFKQAIKIKSDIAEFHTQLGMAYKEKNWESMAQAEFKLALKYNPRDAVAKKNYTGPAEKPAKAETENKGGFFSNLFKFGKKK